MLTRCGLEVPEISSYLSPIEPSRVIVTTVRQQERDITYYSVMAVSVKYMEAQQPNYLDRDPIAQWWEIHDRYCDCRL